MPSSPGRTAPCLPCRSERTAMPRLRLHYEGRVALPEGFRRKLGLERGDEVEAELVGGTIVLKPTKGSAKAQGEDDRPVAGPSLRQGRQDAVRAGEEGVLAPFGHA